MNVKSPRVLVLEDEIILANEIAYQLVESGFEVVVTYSSKEALNVYNSSLRGVSPDSIFQIVLLDIKLAGEKTDGIHVAEKILEQGQIPIFFLTAYASDKEYESRASKVEHYGWLDKSQVKIEEIWKALNINNLDRMDSFQFDMFPNFKGQIAIKEVGGQEYQFIKISDIVLLESDENYTKLHLSNSAIVFYGSNLKMCLSMLEKHLDPLLDCFIRVSRFYVVNIKYIKYFNKSDKYIIVEGFSRPIVVHSVVTSLILNKYILKAT